MSAKKDYSHLDTRNTDLWHKKTFLRKLYRTAKNTDLSFHQVKFTMV